MEGLKAEPTEGRRAKPKDLAAKRQTCLPEPTLACARVGLGPARGVGQGNLSEERERENISRPVSRPRRPGDGEPTGEACCVFLNTKIHNTIAPRRTRPFRHGFGDKCRKRSRRQTVSA